MANVRQIWEKAAQGVKDKYPKISWEGLRENQLVSVLMTQEEARNHYNRIKTQLDNQQGACFLAPSRSDPTKYRICFNLDELNIDELNRLTDEEKQFLVKFLNDSYLPRLNLPSEKWFVDENGLIGCRGITEAFYGADSVLNEFLHNKNETATQFNKTKLIPFPDEIIEIIARSIKTVIQKQYSFYYFSDDDLVLRQLMDYAKGYEEKIKAEEEIKEKSKTKTSPLGSLNIHGAVEKGGSPTQVNNDGFSSVHVEKRRRV